MDWNETRRDELIQRAVRDSAVASAMATHGEHLGDTERRVVHEIAQLAVHTALTQYAAQIKMEIARIESFERMQADLRMMRGPSPAELRAMMSLMSTTRAPADPAT